MVDWETAVSLGSRIAGDGPEVEPARPRRWSPSCRAGADRSTGWCASSPGLHAEERSAPVLVVDRPGWIRPTPRRSRPIIEPVAAKLTEKKGPPSRAARQAVGSRITGAEVGVLLGFLGRQGAGTVRPVRRAGRPAAPGRAQHRPRRARARGRPAATSACGCACTRRPTGCSSPPSRGCATTCSPRSASSSTPSSPTPSATTPSRRSRRGPSRAATASLLDDLGSARAEGDPRPAHRRHVAARGPRRRRHGRRRPEVIPSVAEIRAALQPTAQGRRGRSTSCCAGCSASTPRWRSTATAPPSSAPSSTPGHGRLQRRLGPARPPPVQGRDPDPSVWVSRVLG